MPSAVVVQHIFDCMSPDAGAWSSRAPLSIQPLPVEHFGETSHDPLDTRFRQGRVERNRQGSAIILVGPSELLTSIPVAIIWLAVHRKVMHLECRFRGSSALA